MEEVRQGDVVFSFVRQSIVALGVAASAPYSFSRPTEFTKENDWIDDGYRVDVQYEKIDPPVAIPGLVKDLLPLLPTKYSPLTTNGTGAQGYLFALPPIAARYLLDRIGSGIQTVERAIDASSSIDKTVRRALVECRVGQGLFRENLVRYWVGGCAVSDVKLLSILRASHIKPWRDSNNEERLDHFNGLLLAPSFDALFDQGLIAFSNTGESIHSPLLTNEDATALGINLPVRLKRVEDRHYSYLAHHRKYVFRRERTPTV